MARIRTIKPEFWKNEALSDLPEATHMLAAALLNYADDEGYFNANPKLVQAECCPLREPSVSIHCSLSELSNIGYIQLGTGSDGRKYGRIVHFTEHQNVNRLTPSKIKHLKIEWGDSVSPHGALTEASSLEQGTGNYSKKDSSLRSELSARADDQEDIPASMVKIWNDEVGEVLAKPRKLDKSRRVKLDARYRDTFSRDLDGWRAYCQRIRGSPHLTGDNDRGWRADLDFCLEPKRLNRILEGYYDARKPNGNGHVRQPANQRASVVEAVKRLSERRRSDFWSASDDEAGGESGELELARPGSADRDIH